MTNLTFLQAIVLGLLQGVTELFPVSSLGHSVLVPAWIGGTWGLLVTEGAAQNSGESPYLAFIVALHVATALALIAFYWRDWVRIVVALVTSLRARRIVTSTERLAWLLVVATIPVGIMGVALEHTFRTLFAKPLAASIFLTVNGLILLGAEFLRRRAAGTPAPARVLVGTPATASATATTTGATITGATITAAATVSAGALPAAGEPVGTEPGPAASERQSGPTGRVVVRERRRLETLAFKEAGIIGFFQSFALLAGISRSGISMAAGLLRGLDHEDAAKFSFLLATPVILAAGVLKLPSLAGSAGAHIHGQALAGAVAAGIAAYLSVRFLTRYFTTRTLTPFAVYCLLAGAVSIAWFA